ncbi:SusD/RagB family nutrient-binding outer membrane lipoprotein [Draconibacterium sp. IB214405]|uniref:SusD/RagB family nutrient-binding outer membrane lipoprotein n=1 Tax=Draconibacterium sp. IB214405 TaxID=3097352 RepID=UPI002A124E9F|nr:SusD/RagB family nutrient-binding outer membrane lipoprotein [Draconibacterium sp. IB214405]MDX8339549.1 SusD/RagB family nutrient-binding outer membrane lipoprotein [Draconibacterium sp. IB214405]
MKKITIIFMFLIGVFFTSCDYDLDINNSPNATQEAGPDQRLPYILAETTDFYGSHGTRTAHLTQQLGYAYRPGYRYYMFQNWQFANNADAWVWQCWYGYAWVNIEEMMKDAKDIGAWHYVGVGKILKAFGNGELVDAYGYMAYQDGIAGNIQPDYDDAEYVYSQILPLIDEGIEDLQKSQDADAPALSVGDVMYNGDIDKWLKFAYGVKARFMSHLTKKAEGTDLLSYNPSAILANISKSFDSNADDAAIPTEDGDISARWCIQRQNISSSNKPGKLWKDYLMNTVDTINGAGESWNSGVVDPRAEVLLPKIVSGENAGQYSYAVDLAYTNASPTTSDENYVGMRASEDNPLFYTDKASPYFLITYSELKFIEAETYFRQGNTGSALTSYKEAIQANMDVLGIPADQSAEFLASAAVAQTASELTLSHIMIQKYITLTYSPEAWTDMRRCDYCIGADGTYDYDAGVYKGFKRPTYVYETAFPQDDDYIRRYQMAYYERYYNASKVEALGVFENEYMTTPVWWDIEE